MAYDISGGGVVGRARLERVEGEVDVVHVGAGHGGEERVLVAHDTPVVLAHVGNAHPAEAGVRVRVRVRVWFRVRVGNAHPAEA